MARIEDELMQQEIADSLLGEPQEVAEPSAEEQGYFGGADALDLLDSAVQDQKENRIVHGDPWNEAVERNDGKTDFASFKLQVEQPEQEERQPATEQGWESRRLSAEEARQLIEQQRAEQQPEQQAQPEPSTPEQIRRELQTWDSIIEKNQINDSTANKEFTFSMMAIFGGDSAQYDSEKLGSMLNKQTLTTAMFYDSTKGQLGEFPHVPPASAREYAYDFLRSCNQDPRMFEGTYDQQGLANLAFQVEWSCIDAIVKNPGVTDPRQLNTPQNCEWGYAAFLKTFGMDPDAIKQANPQQFRESALKFGDAKMKHTLSVLRNVNAHSGPLQQPARSSGRVRAPRVPGGRVRGMKSNQDPGSPFNKATIDSYRREHGRL